MPDNKSNKLKGPSIPNANKSMPDVNKEDEFIIDNEELKEPSPSRVPEKLPAGANNVKKTQDGYKIRMNYINRFLTAKKLPAFDDLTPEDVETDHLQLD
jgi:hypothetical protein